MARLHWDIETFSECPLKKAGVYRYSEDESTELLVLCYALDDGPVNVWIPDDDLPEEIHGRYLPSADAPQPVLHDHLPIIWLDPEAKLHIQSRCPADLAAYFEDESIQLGAHNAQFERVIANSEVMRKLGVPGTAIKRYVCTAAKAAAHSLPRALGDCAKALGTYPKDESGKTDMLALTKPRTGKVRRWLPSNAPMRFANLYNYCIDDVKAERDIDHYLQDLSAFESRVYRLDQMINDRGMKVDMDAVLAIKFLIEEYKRRLVDKCIEMTRQPLSMDAAIWCDVNGVDPDTVKFSKRLACPEEIKTDILCSRGIRPSQTAALAAWIRQYWPIDNLQKETVKEIVESSNAPPEVKRILRLYNIYNMKAVSKYDAILNAVCADGRLRGMFIYHTASTGRWSSVIVQLHNLFKSVIGDVDTAIEVCRHRDLDLVSFFFDQNPMRIFASCIRGMLIADEGKEFSVLDFSAIEGRTTHWVAGDEVVLHAYKTHGKVYELAAAQMAGLDVNDIEMLKSMKTREPGRRQTGKITELSMGFGGSVGALARMIRQENAKLPKDQQIHMTEEEMYEAVHGWRRARPKVVKTWYALENAAKEAVANPGRTFKIKNGLASFRVTGDFLYMRLPSGRRLAYFKPRLDADGAISYLGIDTKTRQWQWTDLWYGRLMENWVQAVARDLLAHGLLCLERKGYTLVGHVHDEGISEVYVNFGSLEEAADVICTYTEWAAGLPIKAAGFRGPRYRKDD